MIDHPLDVDLLIFDADGTLRECTVPGQPCPNQPGEWRLKANVETTLQNYPLRFWHPDEPEGTVELALASNQAGVDLGYLSYAMAGQLLWQTLSEALGVPWEKLDMSASPAWHQRTLSGSRLGLSVHWCASHPDVMDMRRKPNPGMLWMAMIEHQVLPVRTLMVGDRPEDELAAEQANVPFMWANDFFGWEETS